MKIINVITSRYRLLENVSSYPIPTKGGTNEARQVTLAEHEFAEECRSHGAEEKDIDAWIEDGHYDNLSGYDVSLIWSNVHL